MKPNSFFIIVLSILLIVILFQNTAVVSFQFLVWKITCSRIFLILLGMIVGFILGLGIKAKL